MDSFVEGQRTGTGDSEGQWGEKWAEAYDTVLLKKDLAQLDGQMLLNHINENKAVVTHLCELIHTSQPHNVEYGDEVSLFQ